MTVGVATVAYGHRYQAFLPEWAVSVAGLRRQPDCVAIVCDQMPGDLQSAMRQIIRCPLHIVPTGIVPRTHPQVLINEAIAALATTWVCKMDVDDRFFPRAFDSIDRCDDHDVLMFGILLTRQHGNVVSRQGMPPLTVTATDILNSPQNLVFSGSPFRRWIWEKARFRDMIYEDWMFWIDAARNGARFGQSHSIDYEYRLHGDNMSLRCDPVAARRIVDELRLGRPT